MVDAGYINKQYILDEFPEFNKYYETGEWKRLMKEMDEKILLKTNPYTSEFLRNEDPYIKRILYE